MAKYQFAATMRGRGEEVQRYGTKATGVITEAAGWGGCIQVRVYHDDKGRDMFVVQMKPWMNGDGEHTILAEGILNATITNPFIVPAIFA